MPQVRVASTPAAGAPGNRQQPGNFYNKPTPGELNTIYTQIAADISRGTSALTSETTP